MKVKILTEGYYIIADWNLSFHLTPHFTLGELANNSGDSTQPQYIFSKYSAKFNEVLEYFRVVKYKKPINVNSCYRQPAYNKAIGGDSKSAHLMACALDFSVNGKTQGDMIARLWKESCEYFGIIGAINLYDTYVHLEAFSDICYGNKIFKIRDKRSK